MVTQMFNRQISLEAELVATKEKLQTTIQEQNATKQELVETKDKLEGTERKLNDTDEQLKIGNKNAYFSWLSSIEMEIV